MGPQTSFTIPQGFLNLNGENSIALAVAAKEAGSGPDVPFTTQQLLRKQRQLFRQV